MPLLRREVAALAALLLSLGGCGSEPDVPTTLTVSPTSLSFTALGQTQQVSPAVSNQHGDPLPGAEVIWGTSNSAVAAVSSTGLVTAQGAGSAQITATAGAVSAVVEVTVVQTPTQLTKISGDGQTAPAGDMLTSPLVVRVDDARSNPVPGATVIFTVSEGEGSVATPTATTGPDGRASTTFTTSTISGSSQEVSASIAATAISVSFTATAAPDPTSFNIGVRFLNVATAAQREAFTDARLRWESLVTGDLQDVQLEAAAEDCGPGTPAVSQMVDDLLILVRLVPIDGPGGILGGAGPCYIRTAGNLTILGVMQFDTADLETLESDGLLSNVILHEMGHVLGFGTLWPFQGLLADPSFPIPQPPATPDPHFTGAGARAEFDNVGGTTYGGAKVPVEDTGGEGTQDSHWRETVFDNELMTGFIGAGSSPLSVVTIASLQDQGYTVDPAGADPYMVMLSLRAFGSRPSVQLRNDVLRIPIKKVDARGRVTGVLRR